MLQKTLRKIETLKNVLVTELNGAIKALPDNSNIQRLGNGCFVINSSDIAKDGGVLCPFFHDFRAQYQAVLEVIKQTSSVEAISSRLTYILENEQIEGKRLHPKVLANLKKIF